MILRRLVAHVRQQQWTAIAIDLVIVILGVFIGIQVSNWNSARADRQRAVGYLERIRDDLDADIDGYRDRLAFWAEVSASGAQGLAYAETGHAGAAAQWDILRAFFWASQVGAFNLTETTYDELKSAGELGLLGDPRLRDQLAYYYTNSNIPVLSESPAYRPHVRGIIPLDVQFYLWEHCWQTDSSGRQRAVACSAPIDDDRARAIVDEIRSDKSLMRELRYWMSTMRVAEKTGRNNMSVATGLRDAVDARLGHGGNAR